MALHASPILGAALQPSWRPCSGLVEKRSSNGSWGCTEEPQRFWGCRLERTEGPSVCCVSLSQLSRQAPVCMASIWFIPTCVPPGLVSSCFATAQQGLLPGCWGSSPRSGQETTCLMVPGYYLPSLKSNPFLLPLLAFKFLPI